MDAMIAEYISGFSMPMLLIAIAIFIYALGKGADLLVDEAVVLSEKWNVPRMLIGATIVSLGTTLPEASISVFAAIQGESSIALGNAVGSVICDTGLILGLATILTPLPLQKSVVNRQGWVQLGAGFLLVISCFPFFSAESVFLTGGILSQQMGVVFLMLLVFYIIMSIRWTGGDDVSDTAYSDNSPPSGSNARTLLNMLLGISMVILSSRILIPAVQETAMRLSVPESIIGATLVAFGTSLPELVTAMTAVKKGYGELAVGNIIGADILNVLFVAGAAATVTEGGLAAPAHFFQILFPAMIFILLVFRIGVICCKKELKRSFGVMLLGTYVAVTLFSYV